MTAWREMAACHAAACAALEREQLERALAAFERVGRELGILGRQEVAPNG